MIAFLDRVKTKMKPVNLQKKPSPNADLCFVDSCLYFWNYFPERIQYFLRILKRRSLSLLSRYHLHGSMTVEASLLVPIFIFFLFYLGSTFEMIRLHNHVQVALYEVGGKNALYDEEFISPILIKKQVLQFLDSAYLDSAPLAKGKKGIYILESQMVKEDKLGITLTYEVKPGVTALGWRPFRMANRYYVHLWNGYEISDMGTERTYVYVTETGKVWHTNRNCTYLDRSIIRVEQQYIASIRNQYGKKYRACEICDKETLGFYIYITKDGKCYHRSAGCPSLKRTVIVMDKEEAIHAGYGCCSRCGRK